MEGPLKSSTTVAFLLRTISAVVGLLTFASLTQGLFSGEITYSVGEVEEVTVTTSGFWDTPLVYLIFSPFGVGLMLAGFAPEIFLKHKWLLKVLIATSLCAYLLEGLTSKFFRS